MQFLIVLAVAIACANAAFEPEFKEKALKKIQEAGAQCAEKEKASGDDISELLAKQPPTRKEGKCLISCFYQSFGIQGQDGKFTVEGAMKSIEPFKTADAEVYGKMKEAFDKCIPQVGDSGDRCENALKMATCATKICTELGLTEEVFM